MSAFRAFMIYDYQRSFFLMFIRRGFQVSPKWNGCRKELENKLQEMVKEPKDNFEQPTDYGKFKCKYDKLNKCYFILLSSNEVREDYQNQVLSEIYELFQSMPNYQKIKKEDLEKKETETIEKLLEMKEQDYARKHGKVKAFEEPYEAKPDNMLQQQSQIQSQLKVGSQINSSSNQRAISQIQNGSVGYKQSSAFNSDKDLSADTLIKIFRCFMMWDYNRQFFFMFIRKGFPIDKTWSQERVKLEAEIKAKQLDPNDPKAKPKEPPEQFSYRGNFGQYRAKYDKKAKCYFILLTRFKIKEDPQIKLLEALYEEVQKVDKYISLKYDALEGKKKRELEKIIDEHEKELANQVSQRFIDTKLMESKLGFIHSPERVSNNNLSSKKSSIFISNQLQQQQQQQQSLINSAQSLQQPQISQQKQQKLQQQQQQKQQQEENFQKKEIQDGPSIDEKIDDTENIPYYQEEGELANRVYLYYTKPLQVSQYIKSGN
ncbi:unnamed protein product (macronuclear) [Paramecium tetraurelia]|uniref:Uncharacterized protein n=1 Tax=Paramecium tetraurelia TaxID=5888 RepID=A0D9G7_PARTE|nr:uncharacterized protein GSPATT00014614001 [Paramecium tetraurelia]CAK79684.1 unnamed protein product [Paramecium tetraurelia]|eukprot:XP_001447081.1 hypothetical protein (macronuclear) [Paramecium tetraurelia strain d4-2]